jgi:uncharacterized protein YecE (DUF72 family)
VLALGPTLGPVLWQLPASLPFDAVRLERFFALLPRTTAQAAELAGHHDDKLAEDRALTSAETDQPLRHALEPRHASFDTPEARRLLADHGVAMVLADSAGRWPRMGDGSADFHYVRLHGDTELYASGYSGRALDRWAEQCRAWAAGGTDVFVYFDNDARGHAPHDALALAARVHPPSATERVAR